MAACMPSPTRRPRRLPRPPPAFSPPSAAGSAGETGTVPVSQRETGTVPVFFRRPTGKLGLSQFFKKRKLGLSRFMARPHERSAIVIALVNAGVVYLLPLGF